ncbi:MAG TPA: response regulator transcription factor [Kofleriaceae bacterium]|nr:response regulator transcription factor [Kofleriaceae bacterium]
MRVLVVCGEPESAPSDPDSVAAVLVDLGCRITLCRFDLGDLDEEEAERQPPTLVVMDAGDELARAAQCRRKLDEIRSLSETPSLLVVTVPRLPALDFSSGFDDFLLRPIVPAELYARLRQLDWRTSAFGSDEVIKIGDLHIDVSGYDVFLGGRRLDFTHQEFELLRFLAQHRGRVFTRDQLLQKVWGYQYAGGTRTVDIHVRRLRAKLGPAVGPLIATVRHVGYKMRAAR